MYISKIVCKQVQEKWRHLLAVTKYWRPKESNDILKLLREDYTDILYGIGENRIEVIKEKNLPREHVHFIGNVQSRKIPEISEYCSCIHSLSSMKHAQKFESLWREINAFIQIRQDESKSIWISSSELEEFVSYSKDFKYLKIIWISSMWAWGASEGGKRKEFQTLIKLRDNYLPEWKISAGTSRDYEIALEEWIDIVRIGNALCN